MDQALIESVVREVVSQLQAPGRAGSTATPAQASSASQSASGSDPSRGLFAKVDDAVDAATSTQQLLWQAGLDVRDGICQLIKDLARENAQKWGQIEYDETKIGRLAHKAPKLELLSSVPGVEFLKTAGSSGDEGICLDEAAPWGVIGVITPVTHSIPTMSANAINMIAAGNTLIVNAHPSGAKCLAMAAAAYNEAIQRKFGLPPLICVINPPTLRTAEEVFAHPRIPLLVATGGPAVARAAMKQSKRAIVAGPGNPPVVVDETADLDVAAKSIIAGGGFDNNLLCIGEKEVFVVESVMQSLKDALRRHGAVELASGAIARLTEAAFTWQKDHYAVKKELVGADPWKLAEIAGVKVGKEVELLFGQTEESNPFVNEEQMMPFVPLVRVRDFEQGLELAIKYEHGFGHTACIHSNNLANITRMGQAMNTTIFVANGPSTAGLGIGGEGYASYSIATPTGEGITTPLTFTRFRRFGISGSLRIV